jgi:hypothetical protein
MKRVHPEFIDKWFSIAKVAFASSSASVGFLDDDFSQ